MVIEIKKTWSELKALCSAKNLNMQYVIVDTNYYYIYTTELNIIYYLNIKIEDPASSDQTDFVNNYMSSCNKPVQPTSVDGRMIVRSESRPLDMTIAWTSRGDGTSTIFDGKKMEWDFSNSDDDITAPSGFKRKRIEFKFIDVVRVKDGMSFFFDSPKCCYIDIYLVCPNGGYYYNNAGELCQATADTVISHYINYQKITGTSTRAIEYNSEGCTDEIPVGYKFWLEVTTPDTDSTSSGHIVMEIFRRRTVIL